MKMIKLVTCWPGKTHDCWLSTRTESDLFHVSEEMSIVGGGEGKMGKWKDKACGKNLKFESRCFETNYTEGVKQLPN